MSRSPGSPRRPSLGSDLLIVPRPGMGDATLFRPRGALGATLTLAPTLGFLALIWLALVLGIHEARAQILLGLGSGALAGWLLSVISLTRVLLPRIAITADELVAQAPLGGEQRLRWSLIEAADLTLGFLRLRSSGGVSVTVLLAGQSDGARLLRETTLRVSPGVLGAPLRQSLAAMGGSLPLASATIPVTARFAVAPLWYVVAGVAAAGGVALATLGTLGHAGATLAAGVVIGLAGAGALIICRQSVTLDQDGISVQPGIGPARSLAWPAILLVERMPLGLRLACQDKRQHRLRLLGPWFCAPARRNEFERVFRARLREHDIPELTRWLV